MLAILMMKHDCQMIFKLDGLFTTDWAMAKSLPYVAGLLQWGKVYGKETSFVGHYYMLNKVFVAAGTSLRII